MGDRGLLLDSVCSYQRCIEAWEVAGSGSVSVRAATGGEERPTLQAMQRAEALVRIIQMLQYTPHSDEQRPTVCYG